MNVAEHANVEPAASPLNYGETDYYRVPTAVRKLLLASIVVAITALSGIMSSSGLLFPPESAVAPLLSSAAFPAQGRS